MAMLALLTHATGNIDLANNAFANPIDGVKSLLTLNFPTKGSVGLQDRYHLPNEFVSKHTSERIVAAQQLQIRATDAGQPDTDEGFDGCMRFGNITEGKGLIFEPEGLHGNT
jgi:hypothetical protein